MDLDWFKSSYSVGNGACVEVAWDKSSHSAYNGNCVEVAWDKSSHSVIEKCVEVGLPVEGVLCDKVHVRDSKNPDGGKLNFSREDWREFIQKVKKGA